jgi:hypothetical protein
LENAQSLSLEGFEPIPLVVLTRREILQNWKSFLGQRIRGHLGSERGKERVGLGRERIELETGEDADDDIELHDDVEIVGNLLTTIWREGAGAREGATFFDLVTEVPRGGWEGAFQALQEQKRPERFIRHVGKALKLAHANLNSAGKVMPGLLNLLNHGRSQGAKITSR